MDKVKLIITLAVAIITLIIILQNTAVVETKLLFVTVSMPLVLLLFMTLLIGFILGVVGSISWRKKPAGSPQKP